MLLELLSSRVRRREGRVVHSPPPDDDPSLQVDLGVSGMPLLAVVQ